MNTLLNRRNNLKRPPRPFLTPSDPFQVVKAKAGHGSATLSMAYAGSRFVDALLRALKGDANVVEVAYVMSQVTQASYFATPLLLGSGGIEQNLGLGELSEYEQELLYAALPELRKNIDAGIEYANAADEGQSQEEDEVAGSDLLRCPDDLPGGIDVWVYQFPLEIQQKPPIEELLMKLHAGFSYQDSSQSLTFSVKLNAILLTS
ncbi:hypothetical protein NQ318_001872 [Aromia moschata]|uniref:Lactate/malate dehydrogenase C-terminal domain-containing protein n=1 Tax=Aromia moschata TaxID=1265417 RepID=A0AAV8Z164_9CUCU|nr:hypothetical protein NQ318_001872 [Aromia moschata]